MQTLLAFILVFGVIVIVHEFGHFYFAKKSGILVREFAIGMGPKLFQTHRNETTYTLRALPIGGYVMMAGYEEDEDIRLGMPALLVLDDNENVKEIDLTEQAVHKNGIPVDVLAYDFNEELYITGQLADAEGGTVTYQVNEDALIVNQDGTKLQIAPAHRQFQNAPLSRRILTNLGGPLNNFILGIVAFTLLAFLQGGVISSEPLIGEIVPESPAATSQLELGDRVLAIDGEAISSWNEMVETIYENPNEPLVFEIEKPNETTYTETIIPAANTLEDGTEVGQIGIYVYMDDSFSSKMTYGFTETWNLTKAIVSSLGMLFTGQFSLDDLGGPVAIYNLTGEVTQAAGIVGVVSFLGFLSVNLGLMNLLPIPALDGGKLLLNFLEAVRGKPLSEDKEAIINLIGVVLILLLMLFVTWNDIQRFFFN